MKFHDIISDYLKDKGFNVKTYTWPNGDEIIINFRLKNDKIDYRLTPKRGNINSNTEYELRRVNLKTRQMKNQFFYEPENILLLTINIYNPKDTQLFYDWIEDIIIKTKVSRG
jgi:hypothetical protein